MQDNNFRYNNIHCKVEDGLDFILLHLYVTKSPHS